MVTDVVEKNVLVYKLLVYNTVCITKNKVKGKFKRMQGIERRRKPPLTIYSAIIYKTILSYLASNGPNGPKWS